MGKTAEELRSEIAQQRSDLTRDFDLIGDKVSPARMVERRTEAVKGRFRRAREAVMGSAEDMTNSASGRLHAAGDAAGGAVGAVGDVVSDAPHRIEQGTTGNPLAAGMVAFGLGVLAATVLPPSRKERELARQVQPQLEQAAHAVVEAGQDVAQEMKPAVQQAGADLSQTAKAAAGEVQHSAQEHAAAAVDTTKQAAADVKGQTQGFEETR